MKEWLSYQFTLGMPHMVPNKLSEVELLKWLGNYQWESISRLLGRKSHEIANLEKDRLYASFISVELFFPSTHPIDALYHVSFAGFAGVPTLASPDHEHPCLGTMTQLY